jgi:hypothetical protein
MEWAVASTLAFRELETAEEPLYRHVFCRFETQVPTSATRASIIASNSFESTFQSIGT